MDLEVELTQQQGFYILKLGYYGRALTQPLSLFAEYNMCLDVWIVPDAHITPVKELLSQFEGILTDTPPGEEMDVRRIEGMMLNEGIERFMESLPKPLLEHQKNALPKIISSASFLLADDMGLGKSAASLASIDYMVKYQEAKRVLIFCQKRAVNQWARYAKTFTPDLDVITIMGHAVKRRKDWKSDHTVFITNLEKIINDYALIASNKWDIIVLDEASYFIKNPESKRAKHICRLKANKRLALTGTPIENSLVDLFSLFKFLQPELFGSYRQFERDYVKYIVQKIRTGRYIRGKPQFINIKKIVGYTNIDKLKSKIAPYYIRRTEKDVDIDLPEIMEEYFTIPLKDRQKQVYMNILKNVKGLMDRRKINAENNRIKLLRACDHAIFADPKINSSNKIDSLLEILYQNSHRKVLVFSQWADMIKQIHLALGDKYPHSIIVGSGSKKKFDKKIVDEDEFNKFQNECNVLIATDAVSRSQDFPFVSVVINVDLPWNPATIRQRIMRARRISSTNKTIFAFNMVSENTIEEKILPVLQAKMKLAKDVIDDNEFQSDIKGVSLYDLIVGD